MDLQPQQQISYMDLKLNGLMIDIMILTWIQF